MPEARALSADIAVCSHGKLLRSMGALLAAPGRSVYSSLVLRGEALFVVLLRERVPRPTPKPEQE